MINKETHKKFTARETQKEEDKEAPGDLKSGSETRDVVEASEDDVQEASFGNRSYAAPDFNDDKD